MQQGPLQAATALNTANQGALTRLDPGNNLRVTNVGDTALVASGYIDQAIQIKVGPGILKAVENLSTSNLASLSTTQVSGLKATQIGCFYDALSTTALTTLTTAAVAALTTSNLMALAPINLAEISFGAGNGIPFTNGLIYVPSGGALGATPNQPANVIYK